FAQLIGVHLTETLEALKFYPLLRDRHHGRSKRLEGGGCLAGVAETHVERGAPGELDELRVHTRQLPILLGVEQRPPDAVGAREAGLRLDGLDAYLDGIHVNNLGGVRLALEAGAGKQLDRG